MQKLPKETKSEENPKIEGLRKFLESQSSTFEKRAYLTGDPFVPRETLFNDQDRLDYSVVLKYSPKSRILHITLTRYYEVGVNVPRDEYSSNPWRIRRLREGEIPLQDLERISVLDNGRFGQYLNKFLISLGAEPKWQNPNLKVQNTCY